jgi:ABC-type branched-subunit amino acid transport system substrate-binding protein
VTATLRAYFEELNAAGGVYGRRIELRIVDYVGDHQTTVANARHLIEEGQVFCVIGAFAAGLEPELFTLFEDNEVPQVGPYTLFAGHDAYHGRSTFFLLSGLPDQARALVDYAALELRLAPAGVAVVLAADQAYDEVARAVQQQAGRRGWPAPIAVRFSGARAEAAGLTGQLKGEGIDAVFYFGPGRGLPVFTAEAAARGWLPRLFVSGLVAARATFEVPPAFADRLFLAYSNLPADQTRAGVAEFQRLRDKYGLPKGHLAAQLSAYAGAKVLVEGLRRAGRALSRDSLVAALEGLAGYETGLMPPVSFGPNRRVGAKGAHVLKVDLAAKRFAPKAAWIRLD